VQVRVLLSFDVAGLTLNHKRIKDLETSSIKGQETSWHQPWGVPTISCRRKERKGENEN